MAMLEMAKKKKDETYELLRSEGIMNTVQNFEIFAPKLVDKKEYLSAGPPGLPGMRRSACAAPLLKALGDDIVVANATGCMEIISSGYPQTAWEVPYVHVAFENAAAVGSGVEAALKALRRKGRSPTAT